MKKEELVKLASKLGFNSKFTQEHPFCLLRNESLRWALWLAELQKFIREQYSIHVTITSISQGSWQCHITRIGESLGKLVFEDFYCYEDTLAKGLKEAINLINK